MPLRHISKLGAACFLALAVAAQERLGPEVRLTPNGPAGPAVFDQEGPAVASNGEGFLAVWSDRREGNDEHSLYGTRLNAEGTPARAFGERIGGRNTALARLASNGSDYVVAWVDNGGTHTLRVDEEGRPSGATNTLDPFLIPEHLASNGSTYLLLGYTPASFSASRLYPTLLDADGRELWKFDAGPRHPLWLGVSGSSYEYIDATVMCTSPTSCRVSLALHTLTESGTLTDVALPVDLPAGIRITVAEAPDRFLIAWHHGFSAQSMNFMIVGRDGNLLSGPFELAVPSFVTTSSAIWDDGEFLFMMHHQFNARALRLPASADPRDRTPFEISATAATTPVPASNGAAKLLVWSDTRFSGTKDIVARPVDAVHPALVSRSDSAQRDVQIAQRGGHQLAVWLDEPSSTIAGVLDGVPLTLPGTSAKKLVRVAAGAENFLVAWWEAGNGKVLARRVAFDGQLLDSAPIEVLPRAMDIDLDVVYGNSSYLVAGTAEALFTAQVADDGTVFDPRQFQAFGIIVKAKALWSGTHFFVAVASGIGAFIEPWIGDYYTIAMLRLGSTTEFVKLAEQVDTHEMSFTAATGRDRMTVVWKPRRKSTSQVAQVGFDLRVIASAKPGPIVNGEVDLIWTGAEYLLAWSDPQAEDRIRAHRLDESGGPIEATFEISPPRALRSAPSLALVPGGTAIAYSRSDAASGGAPRAFVRIFNQMPPRRRGIRH